DGAHSYHLHFARFLTGRLQIASGRARVRSMDGAKGSERRSGCPLNAALETFGDRWSLLIVRDLMLFGRQTYNEFLAGGERIATNVLAERLRRLERAGL